MWKKLDKIAKTEVIVYSIATIFVCCIYFFSQFDGLLTSLLLFLLLLDVIMVPKEANTRAKLQELKELKEQLGLIDEY